MKAARLLTRRVWRRGARHGVAAAVEHVRVLRRLEAATVIDVGANRGQFALAVRAMLPGAHVHAIEPLAPESRTLARVAAAVGGITVHPAAVARARDMATLHVTARRDSTSLLPPGDLQPTAFPGTDAIGHETTITAPLADLVPPDRVRWPLLLKLDVQGAELDVLAASEPLLARADAIICECSDVALYAGQALRPAIAAFLRARGFRLALSYNAVHRPGIGRVQADVLFLSTATRRSAAGAAVSASSA